MEYIDYEVLSSHDDGSRKVVEVLVCLQGAEGQTEKKRYYTWRESERYTLDASGRLTEKTGRHYKEEIRQLMEAEFGSKKANAPQRA